MARRLGTLAALLALSCAVQVWMNWHAVVPAQDCIRYVLMAQTYEREGLLAGLKSESEHPLFPVLVWLTHSAAEHLSLEIGWGASAQLTASALLVLCLVPVYFLLLRLVDQSSAAAGAVFFCVMTAVARLGADALSDSTHLLCYSGAVYCLARGARERQLLARPLWWLPAGVMIGLALLARAEAAVLLPTMLIALAGLQVFAVSRSSWPHVAAGIGLLLIGVGCVQLPCLAASGALSRQSLVARLLGRDQPPEVAEPARDGSAGWRTPDGRPMAFGIKDRSVSTRFAGHAAAAQEYFKELPEAMHYWIGALALLGVWQLRGRLVGAFDRLLVLLFVTHSLAAIHFAAGLGYLSARHLLPLVPLALAPAGHAAIQAGNWWRVPPALLSRRVGWAAVIVAAIACLTRTLTPLHPTRIGHRQAGQWLAAPDRAPGAVLDTRGWTALYSGRPTLRYDFAKTAYKLPDLAYVVVEQRELELDSARARTLLHMLSSAAEPVAMFEAPPGRRDDNVLVYRWHPERFTPQILMAAVSN